ncbi:hypothetical protein PanWU01x14_065290, partial [Parasponia andersonii]
HQNVVLRHQDGRRNGTTEVDYGATVPQYPKDGVAVLHCLPCGAVALQNGIAVPSL